MRGMHGTPSTAKHHLHLLDCLHCSKPLAGCSLPAAVAACRHAHSHERGMACDSGLHLTCRRANTATSSGHRLLQKGARLHLVGHAPAHSCVGAVQSDARRGLPSSRHDAAAAAGRLPAMARHISYTSRDRPATGLPPRRPSALQP